MRNLLAASLLAITIAGCTTERVVVEKQPEVTSPALQTQPTPARGEDAYISNVISMYPELINKLGRNGIIEYAKVTCDSIDDGMTLQDLLEMTVRNGVDAEMVGFLTGEAIRNFCPENQWFIDAAINA